MSSYPPYPYQNQYMPTQQAQQPAPQAPAPGMVDDGYNPDATRWQQQQQGQAQQPVNTAQMTPAALRQHARNQNWSEDFDRFSDAQLQQWLNKYWDPSAGKFKSQHAGVTGYFEKPTECPNGMTPFGAKENAVCLPNNDPRLYPVGGSGAGQNAGNSSMSSNNATTFGQSGTLGSTGNQMTDMLINQFNTKQNVAGTGSNLFGWIDGRKAGGWKDDAGNTTSPGQGTQKTADTTGRLLKGGGLWWTNTKQAKDVFGKTPTATVANQGYSNLY